MKNELSNSRQSMRLKQHDYAQEGWYFITICTFQKKCLFGKINDGKMQLNQIGKIVEKCWQSIPMHFPDVTPGIFIIMPNHIHGIINIGDNKGKTLGSIVRGFKIGVTKWVRSNTTIQELWQRNYYEHIIRNEKDYLRIYEYIVNNPLQWELDSLYRANEEDFFQL